MFPHNSSSHEISTETNAFVQNSMGDVVVLGESSLRVVRLWEREGSEHTRYCDIESTNSSMMAAPISHPEATAANDFSTVLPNQAGEFYSNSKGKACQSVAPATTKYPTNHLLICDNNNKINNHNNAEHNHHKYRKQNTPGLLGLQLGSSANNSKSICKALSDNKISFSHLNIRVLSISVNLQVIRDEAFRAVGVPSLVRIPKSDSPQRLLRHPNSIDNYSLLGSCLESGDNNKYKVNFSYISNNKFKSVILLSSTSYSNHYLLFSGGFDKIAAVILVLCIKRDDTTTTSNRMKLLGDKYALVTSFAQTSRLLANDTILDDDNSDIRVSLSRRIARHLSQTHFNGDAPRSVSVYAQNFAASSSITLIVSRNEVIDHTLRSFLKNLTQLYVQSSISPLCNVTVTELMQHICVPILITCKNNDDYKVRNKYNEYYYYNGYSNVGSIEEEINISNNNPDVIRDIVDIAVCYKTSVIPTNVRILGSQKDRISCTEATIFTVGALLFQDNNKPFNTCFKISQYRELVATNRESNSIIKSVSRSTLSDKCSNIKLETSHAARLDESDNRKQVKLTVNIPIMTTCKPTMTLTCQSATVASQTIVVPVSRAESRTNDNEMRLEYFNILQNDQISIQSMLSHTTDDLNKNDSRHYDATKFKDAQNYAIDQLKATTTSKDDAQLTCENKRDALHHFDQNRTNHHDHDNAIICNSNEEPIIPCGLQWSTFVKCVPPFLRYYRRANEETNECKPPRLHQLKYMLELLARKQSQKCNEPIASYKQRWGIPMTVRLVGGGESSLNSGGATNWGTTQTTTSNNNNANQSGWGGTPGNPSGAANAPNNWGGNTVNRSVAGNPNQNQNQGPPGSQNTPGNVSKVNNPNQQSNQQSGPPTSQSNNPPQGNQNNNQWPQGKSNNPGALGQNPSVQSNNSGSVQQQQSSGSSTNTNQPNNPAQGTVSIGNTAAANNPSTKQQLEQLNTMRETLFSHDGWGCQNVNQDTTWDVPSSPEPSMSKDGVPIWKPPVNNGTDLWEANLRNGGQPPPQQQSKTPWGHTPATNIGGTWGEDDEAADSSNMWTGAPTPSQPSAAQWTGAAGNQAGSNWGDPRIDHRDPRDLRSVESVREMRDPRDHRMSLDPRDHMRVMDPMARDPRMADMRGDPRGISGRLHGVNADAMWNQPPGPPHHQMGHQHPSGPPAKMLNPSNMNQWAAPPPKDIMPGKPSGWEEPSPPTQRRNVPNYDDGTSLWGNPGANQRAMPGSKVSHWKDLPTPNLARGGMQCPPGMPQNRMPGQPGMKPDVGNPMSWSHPGAPSSRNGTWTDGPHDTASWDDPKTPATWNEPQLNPAWGGPTAHKPKPMGPAGSWADSDMDPTPSWAHPAKPTLTKEIIWNSREFRHLCELGFKKEDVEVALRSREMNRDEALELLNQLRPLSDQWRRHDTHSGYDPTHQATTAPAYPRFNHVAQQMSFPPTSRASQNQPSTQQLRMLVQQIQLAVHEGYLNHQILNQPLAPQTLILLNQLLQQIKVLQQLHQQHAVQSTMKGNNQSALQINVQITKTKQQITNLQNQIAVQQATYMKQQQQHPAPPSQASEYYKSSVHDPMSALPNSFSELTMNKEPPVSQQQSRLNQWKLPSLDKDGDLVSNEFSRAPGTTSKQPATPGGLTQSHSSPNMNPLLGQGDGTWSSRLGDSGWPDPSNSDSTDGKDWQPGGAAYTDLVPEFEPGKPWKGTQIKSIEDDPSITPGSVVRSPLSLATIKDPDTIFSSSSKTSPPPQAANPDTSIPSLSNSTWTFNPPATTPSAFTSTTKNTWGESAPPPTAVTSELWGAPMSKARGPPPGLNSKGATNASNGWGAGLGSVSRSSSSWGLQSSTVSNSGWMSTWLLLKNLTPQIDGSTLKTLCMQHGPVQDFRLYQNHGIALTKYSSRDEAIKAQGALNNCVLGNTTIFAESPAESEVHTILQQLGHGGQQQAGGSGGAGWGLRPTNKAGPPPDTWGGSSSQLWGAPPTSNSLWSNAGIDNSDQQRATPSSLNSYLPGDLLGGETTTQFDLQ